MGRWVCQRGGWSLGTAADPWMLPSFLQKAQPWPHDAPRTHVTMSVVALKAALMTTSATREDVDTAPKAADNKLALALQGASLC